MATLSLIPNSAISMKNNGSHYTCNLLNISQFSTSNQSKALLTAQERAFRNAACVIINCGDERYAFGNLLKCVKDNIYKDNIFVTRYTEENPTIGSNSSGLGTEDVEAENIPPAEAKLVDDFILVEDLDQLKFDE
jgi:hypothetical protein